MFQSQDALQSGHSKIIAKVRNWPIPFRCRTSVADPLRPSTRRDIYVGFQGTTVAHGGSTVADVPSFWYVRWF
jgi:hypothetical protein